MRVGGHDVRDLTQELLGRQIAMVLQEPFLFTGTVIENIRYHKADATREEVVAAARAVGAHEFIMRLPRGLRHRARPARRRAVARAAAARQLRAGAGRGRARSSSLDEATASVDSYTEMLIQKALMRLLEGRTGLVIAHRLATIRGADRIIVLQNGEVVETGTHAELVALRRALCAALCAQLRLLRRHPGRGGRQRVRREASR